MHACSTMLPWLAMIILYLPLLCWNAIMLECLDPWLMWYSNSCIMLNTMSEQHMVYLPKHSLTSLITYWVLFKELGMLALDGPSQAALCSTRWKQLMVHTFILLNLNETVTTLARPLSTIHLYGYWSWDWPLLPWSITCNNQPRNGKAYCMLPAELSIMQNASDMESLGNFMTMEAAKWRNSLIKMIQRFSSLLVVTWIPNILYNAWQPPKASAPLASD